MGPRFRENAPCRSASSNFSTLTKVTALSPVDGGDDSFVHITAVEQAGMATLTKDQRVSYEIETDRRGKQSAVNLASAG
jgi:CspA family cold shock protein